MSASGGYLYFDKDSECTDNKKSALETAVWDATTLASYASTFPNAGEVSRGRASGIFYMGPDFASQQNRTSGNLKRAAEFKTDKTSAKEYITISCKDTKDLCDKVIDGKAVGGYAWTYSGYLYYYYYITLCPTFFTLETLDTKINDVEQDLAKGDTKMAKDMEWLRTTGQFFLHEMMHTRIADGGTEPHIIDEYVAPVPKDEVAGKNEPKAYGPHLVHSLAKRPLTRGGGATRASTNADSYAMWWDTTGYFPGEPGKESLSTTQDDFGAANFPISIHLGLDNDTNPSTADLTRLFTDEMNAFGNGPPDPDDIDTSSSATPPEATSPAPPPQSTPTPPLAEDTCGDWYKFLFDHFEIYGKNSDPEKFGQDGSGLKEQIKGT
ncbi:MAG: hypothetical protein Q9160_005529 [Pyrenula sp. 1 TL-2023]